MNVSGQSIGAARKFFKVDPADVLVVHDDVDLEPGRLQAKFGGGLAGHNGLRSIAQALGRTTSCACGSVSGGPEGATGEASPTTSSAVSSPKSTSMS